MLEIEIVECNIIEGGIEVFARAWRDGEQIGFGDGTVDIERFRLFNPPLLVPDGTFRMLTDAQGIERREDNFKEDPEAAIVDVIAHNISIMKNVHSAERIVPDKRGNTTSTFYCDNSYEDGRVGNGGSTTWSTVRDAATGNDAGHNDTSITAPYTGFPLGGSTFYLYRLFTLFDTSSLPDTDSISAATYSLYINGKNNADNDGDDFIAVVTTTPASNSALVVADYSQVGSTEQHDSGERKDITSISTGAYTNWTLNATGIGNVSKTGVTKFGAREGHDLLNTPYAGASGQYSGVAVTMSETTGTTQDPKLVVEHAAAAATFIPRVMFM